MHYFLDELLRRSAPLAYFGGVCLVGALVCGGLVGRSRLVAGAAPGWDKPLRFFCSVAAFAWTMAWYLGYLGLGPAVAAYSWAAVAVLTAELLWIGGQAARGQRSHFNASTPGQAALSATMGLLIVGLTLWTAVIGGLFWQTPLPGLPPGYAWAIRLSIGLFVVFALEGGLMVRRGGYAVGGPDGAGPTLPGLGWSRRVGDLRVAHFVGLHALQVLPLLAWYGRLSGAATGLVALLYAALAVAVLGQALRGRPLLAGRAART